ncbi:hypothetical protein WL93_21890 [Burkholderia diffusa]|nr:hypothetical protein WL93_21890 [Burkholderia diffusa]
MTTGLFTSNNVALISLFKQLGPGVLRIGGSSVNKTTWNSSGSGGTAGSIAPADVDNLAGFLQKTGWKVIYGINFATETTGQMSSEVAYATVALGSSLIGFELGNEPDLYASTGLRPSTYTFADFLNEWNTDAAAIRSAVPTAVFAGPASSWDYKKYTVPFAQAERSNIGLLTHHNYIGSSCPNATTGYAPSISGMLASVAGTTGLLQTLASAAATNGIFGGARMAEANSYYSCTQSNGTGLSGAPGVSNAFASALWATAYLFANTRYGIAGVNFHSGGTAAYSPIQTKGAAVFSVQPMFYGIWLFAQAASTPAGTLMSTQLSMNVQPALQINGYDVLAQDGSHRVVITNESASDASVTIRNLPASATTAALTLINSSGGLSDTAPSDISVNGSQLQVDGAWNTVPVAVKQPVRKGSTTVNVPAGSALLAVVR